MLLCFDMDNTLVYSDRIHVEAFERAFEKNGLKRVDEKKLKSYFGMVGSSIIRILFPMLDDEEVRKVMHDHNELVIMETAKYAKAVEGADDALKELKRKGFKLALISNCSHKEINAVMKSAGISIRLFDAVIGSDDVLHPKPFPDELLKAKALLKAKRVYMIGDTTYDIETGKKAGAETISVLTGSHTEEMLKRKKPDYIVQSVAQLPALMEKIKFRAARY